MKSGYSILLGEHIDASDIEYRDCEPFQIVCPACNEPLFKVKRTSDGNDVHYLSHYNADNSYSGDCELRVTSHSQNEVNKQNKIARDQRLTFFISVLREMIGRHEMYKTGTTASQKMLSKSKALSWLCDVMYKNSVENLRSDDVLSEIADEYVKDVNEVGAPLHTTFSYAVQKRIAHDMWMYLLSAKGESNFRFLFNHAYIVVVQRLNTHLPNESQGAIAFMNSMLGYLAKIPQTSKDGGMRLLAEMASRPIGPPYAIEGSNYFNKAASEISHEMMGCLLGLPYFEFLKDSFITKRHSNNEI